MGKLRMAVGRMKEQHATLRKILWLISKGDDLSEEQLGHLQ